MSVLTKQNDKLPLFVIFLFIIYPLATLPLLLYEIYRGKRYAYSVLAIYIGYFALLYPPAGDLYRYREDYFYYKNETFSYFLTYLTFKLDFILSFLLYTLGNINIPSDYSRFIYTWIGSELLFSIFYDLTRDYRNNRPNSYFILFIIYWLYVNFIVLMYRHGFSSALFAYGYYNFYYKSNRKISLICFILCVLNHFSYIVFVGCVFIQNVIKYKGHKIISLVCMTCFLFFSFDMVSSLIEKLPLPEYIQSHLLAYTSGFWAQDFLEGQSLKNIILTWTNKFRIISLFVIYILHFHKSQAVGFLTLGTIILMFSNVSNTISARFEIALLLPFLIFVYELIIKEEIKKFVSLKRIFILIGLLYVFTSFWSHRREYSISYEYKIFLPTSFNILTTSYSQNWVDQHIDQKGEPIGLY